MRTKLLLNPGTGWSGTTPFYYTLRNSKFCHAGYKKEFHYLQMMYLNNQDFTDWMIKRYTEEKPSFRTGKFIEKTAEYNKDYYKKLLKPEHSFDKYIQHMHYMKDCFPDYNAVCDFSNYNNGLPEDFMIAHASALKSHFDVKITFLIADPVFRYYMEIGGLINQHHSSQKQEKIRVMGKDEDPIFNEYIRNKQQRELFKYCLKNSRISKNCHYQKNIQKLSKSYGKKNVLVLEMEKIWDSSYHKETFSKLSEFLDYEISPNQLYPNQYMSSDKNIEGLKDQNTEFESITVSLYELGKKHLCNI